MRRRSFYPSPCLPLSQVSRFQAYTNFFRVSCSDYTSLSLGLITLQTRPFTGKPSILLQARGDNHGLQAGPLRQVRIVSAGLRCADVHVLSPQPIPALDSRQQHPGRAAVLTDNGRSRWHAGSAGSSSQSSHSMPQPLPGSSYSTNYGPQGVTHSLPSSHPPYPHSTRNAYPMHAQPHRHAPSPGGTIRIGPTHTSGEDRWMHTPSSSVDSSASPLSPSGSESDELADDDSTSGPSAYGGSPPGIRALDADDVHRRHECPHCHRRFNRPSSLGIHINTHTGERRTWPSAQRLLLGLRSDRSTAFVCPYTGCGKRFNVNSNMRRHYRKHLAAVDAPAHPAAGYAGHPHPHDPVDLQFIRYQDRYQDDVPVGFSPAKFS